MYVQVKDKRLELEKLKSTFVRRASDFLRKYFSSVVDFMISDKTYFSQVSVQSINSLVINCILQLVGCLKYFDAFDRAVHAATAYC